ncbi:MAG: hypothetical protein J6T98_11060 [Salinivirgaceae bacterium]|nr:hypothetical protein [Salinivirgaceae bacterium]
MKKRLIMIMAAAIIILIGCVKDPAKLGIHPNTLYKGRVIEKSQNKPIKGVTVSVTDGSHVHTSQVTGDDGRFEFRVDFDDIDDNYSLQLDCQGYTSLKEDLKGFGQESYDYKDIVYYDNSNPSNWPNVSTKEVSEITSTTARTGGTITYSGAAEITARGVCWGTTHTPDIDGNHTTDGSGTGSFTSNLTNLSLNTTYFVRAYATNMHGTYYGEEKTFTTNDGSVVVTTNNVTNVTPTSATCGGTVTVSSGNTFPITSRGVCWATTHNPTIDNAHTSDGSGVGSFISSITGLTVNTNYYVRAYATNEVGTFYGEEKNFNTTMGLATVTTKDITDIHPLSATGGGVVTNDNGFTITSRGVCWSVVQNPTINDNHTTNGVGTGEFNTFMENLQNSTTYHVRAYATNANGTAYGEDKSFTTTSGAITVTTNSVTGVGPSSATCGGNATLTSDNNLPITAKGVCWSTGHNPSISNSHTTDGTGPGIFTSTIYDLTVNTMYYVRAYATNQLGTYYGEEKSFTTAVGLPAVTTTDPTLNGNTVTTGGNVISDGGYPVTARGICYGPLPNPDLTSTYSHTTDGSGTGYFSSSFTLLGGSGTYYIRAYATNANGTTYGEQVTVIHPYDTLPTFTYNGHTYRVAPDPHASYTEYISWIDANTYCENLTAYGCSDWRMPTLEELQTMYLNRETIGGFFEYDVESGPNWAHYYTALYHSSTTSTDNSNHYKIIWRTGQSTTYYESGSGLYSGNTTYNVHVRPIRIDH